MHFDSHFPKFPFQTGLAPLPGRLLLAEPMLGDPGFSRSVVLLCEQGAEGALGFVLNRQTEYTLSDLLPQIPGSSLPVFQGGPVQMNTLHMLHQMPQELGGKELAPGIFWGGNYEALQEIEIQHLHPEKIRLLIGYAGWATGQLEKELEEASWLVAETNRKLVFETEATQMWQQAIRSLGPDFATLIRLPIDPQLN